MPGAHQIDITMLSAHFDGTNAAVAWLPCIEILSDGGTSCGIIPMDSSVAAGASVEATWAPFLRGQPAAATGAGAEWFLATRSGNTTFVAGDQERIVWQSLSTSNSSVFSLVTGNAPNDTIQVAESGVVCYMVGILPAFPNVGQWQLQIGAVTNKFIFRSNGTYLTNPYYATQTVNAFPTPADFGILAGESVPFDIFGQLKNNDSVSRTFSSAEIGGIWWPNAVLGP